MGGTQSAPLTDPGSFRKIPFPQMSPETSFLENEDIGRDLAIPAIGIAPWGTHFCQFYDTKQDLLDTLVPFFRAGLESNEKCVWITSEPLGAEEAAEALSREVGDLERRLTCGQMWFLPHEAWYGDSGGDQSERYLQAIAPGIEQALAEGYSGLRGTGNASWVQPSCWKPYMDYEAGIGRRYGDQRLIALCTFPLVMCDFPKMLDVLMRHRFALVRHGDWTLIEPSADKRATAAVEQMNTALAQRTMQLQAALTELQAALADLREFSRWVTHDLRAPLRAVRAFGDLLAETVVSKLDGGERRMFERIRSSADRMDTLITDILGYSTAQQNTPRPRPVNLETLARQAWETLTDTASARRVHLQIQPLPAAYGDPAMLQQVLANLLGNAIKFTTKTPDPYVEVSTRTVDGEGVYCVRDNGVGFNPACAETIFGAFQRLHSKAEYEGTGLGLTIAKQIITRHGGHIWAEATPGAGATFCFTLPGPAHS